jgi:hypothetical protein
MSMVKLIYTEGLTTHLTLKLVDYTYLADRFFGFSVGLRNTHHHPEYGGGGVLATSFPLLPAPL